MAPTRLNFYRKFIKKYFYNVKVYYNVGFVDDNKNFLFENKFNDLITINNKTQNLKIKYNCYNKIKCLKLNTNNKNKTNLIFYF